MLCRNLCKLNRNYQNLKKCVRYRSQAATVQDFSDNNYDVANLKVGDVVHDFEVQKVEDVLDFNLKVIQLEHRRTKAHYLHLFRNDSNNVFSINFRTTPRNSTGLPHILEHLVLCGSDLYPARDPFFKMLNRSLATFMNAMTGSDYTIYPFSTQNYTDYRNLQKIYLDAVFSPKLKELDFMQEGWRLENENPQDIKSNLIIKGVVYNEMKGAFSENENILMQKLQNLILPDHTYSVISGGDPLEIPSLTWNDLKQFHKEHYHPSNAKFYSYGNFPLSPTLEYLNAQYLVKYDYQVPENTLVPSQKRWDAMRKEHIVGRFDNMHESFEKQNTLSISLVLSDITDIYETFLLQFVIDLLIKGPNSPFYKSMIEPNFSGGFTPYTGYDKQPRDSIFTLGLQGLKKNDFEKVSEIFDKTVDEVVENGFEKKNVESVLHQYELHCKHEMPNFGLALLFDLTPILNHNGDAVNALKVNQLIQKLKSEMVNNENYLQEVVKKYFKSNNHRLVLSMSADKDYENRQVAEEKKLISEKVSKLSDVDKKEIQRKALELLNEQQKPVSGLLPTLQMSDIKNEIERTPQEILHTGPITTQVNLVNTNGVTYFKGIINTSSLTAEQQLLLPLFTYVIAKMGTDKYDYREFDNMITQKTAGLNFGIHLADSLYQLHLYEPGLTLSSYCLDQNVEDMWHLWKQIFTLSELKNVERLKTLIQLYMTNLTHGIADSGHVYAMLAASSMVSGASYQRELLTGLQHIIYMKRLIQTSSYAAIMFELTNIAKALFDTKKMRCSLNISNENKNHITSTYEKFINELPTADSAPGSNAFSLTNIWAPTNATNCQHHVLNVPVYFCSKAIATVPYTNPEFASLRILAKIISAKYLHPELREKHGAYGGGARISSDGVLSFFSYRDPHNLQTIDIFDNSYNWMQSSLDKLTPQDLLEAKLGVFQSVDAPIPPCSKGDDEFSRRLTPDILQRQRAEIMSVDKDELRNTYEKYLDKTNYSSAGKVILGPKSKNLDFSNRLNELWTVIE